MSLTTKDDHGTPGSSLTDAQSLISEHVDAIVDLTGFDATWESAVEHAKIPVVGGDENNPSFNTNPDFYDVGQTEDSAVYAVVDAAKSAGAKKLGVIYCAEYASCASTITASKTAAQQLGVSVVYSASISATAPNYTAQCVAARQAGAQALAVFDVTDPLMKLGADCSQQNYDPTYATEGTGFSLSQASAPGLKTSLWSEYGILPFWDAGSPAIQAMDRAVDKYYPGLRNNSTAWAQGAAFSWPAGLLLEAAVKTGGLSASESPSAAEIIEGLDSLHGETLDGWAPPLTFTAGQDHHVDCWFTARVKNGAPALVNNAQTTCEAGS